MKKIDTFLSKRGQIQRPILPNNKNYAHHTLRLQEVESLKVGSLHIHKQLINNTLQINNKNLPHNPVTIRVKNGQKKVVYHLIN